MLVTQLRSILHKRGTVYSGFPFNKLQHDLMGSSSSREAVGDDVFATEVTPNLPESYYEEQGQAYFDMISGYDANGYPSSKIPKYSDYCVRWEWEPWLLLTSKNNGNKAEWLAIDALQKITLPCKITNRKVKIFKKVCLSVFILMTS